MKYMDHIADTGPKANAAALICVLCVLCAASSLRLSAAIAADPATQPAAAPLEHQLRIWVSQLGSDDPRARQSALGQLMQLNRDDLPALRSAALSQSPLLPEQIAAIRQAVAQIFLAGEPYDYATDPLMDRGFLGLQWSQEDLSAQYSDGISVSERIPGSVAYRLLQPGDVLVKIIRRPAQPDIQLHDVAQFTTDIQRMRPGDVLRLQVLRSGQRTDVSIPLDHRPLKVDSDPTGAAIQQWLNVRSQAVQDYWNREFSAVDPSRSSPSTQP
jgi:hypothetical protein